MFDLANDRLSYGEILRPDAGYQLDFAVGMTYSLDLEALLGVPVALGLLDEMDEGNLNSPLYVLEAIRKSADRIALFCNAGSIKLPVKIQSIYSLLENCVFQVKRGITANFHPKIWALKYDCDGLPSYIKLIVLSRNLTFDSSIDICVSMQGIIDNEKHEKNRPLADLLRFISDFAGKKKQQILSVAEDIEKVASFEVSTPFEDYDFYPIGIPGYTAEELPLFGKKQDLFAVSPFLSDDIVADITKDITSKERCTLITRKSSVTSKILDSFAHVYVTKDVLNDNEYGVRQDVHAKIYYTSTIHANYIYLGSANASHNAFYRNIECLLRLRYKLRYIGYEKFFADFLPTENCPYEEIISLPEIQADDKRNKEIDKALRETVFAINHAQVIETEGLFSVLVKSKQIKSKEKVEIAPLQRMDLMRQMETETMFPGMLIKELSEFYVLRVDSQSLVVKLKTYGMPINRDQEIYRSIIDTRPKLMKYLSFVLSGDLIQEAGDMDNIEGSVINSNESSRTPGYITAIYEQMLRVFHNNPVRIKGIADMIQRLDPEVVGEEFRQLLGQFQLAAKKVHK